MSALVSSLLTEVNQSDFKSEQEKENAKAKVISRLLLSDWNDSVEYIAPLLFTMIYHSEASEKMQGWRLLPLLLRSQYRRHIFVVKPLCQFIDKQAFTYSIKEARQLSSVMMEVIYEGVNSILAMSLDVNEVSNSIDTQLVKLISSCLDLIKDITTSVSTTLFALQVMTALVTAKGRLFTPQQLNRCISMSFHCLSDAYLYSTAANLMAVCASYGSCDLFENMWKCLSNECTRLLQILGLGAGGNDQGSMQAAAATRKNNSSNSNKPGDVLLGLQLPVNFTSDGGRIGIQKALFIEVSYRGLCAALAQLARLGNTSGPIAQDFRADVATSLNIAICHRSAVSSNEAKFTMENQASISPAHVSVVWPQLTLHALSLLAVLQSTVGASPLLYPFAGTACSCVSSALTHVFPSNKKAGSMGSCDTLTACSIKALECFKYILRSFPTLVITKCEQLLVKFVDIFSQQVQYLTSDPQQQLDADANNSFNTNKDLVIASFEVCETLLMVISVLLPVAMRQQLEVAVHRGLQCLVKGVMFHSFLTLDQGGNTLTSQRMLKHVQQNKKVRRELCEAIRSDADVQKYFLLVACAEVQTSYVDGSRSANLPLLSSAASVCSSHPVTASVCGRVGLCAGNILFPAGVGLPSPPLIEVAHKKILEHNAFIEHAQDRESNFHGGVTDDTQAMGVYENDDEEDEQKDEQEEGKDEPVLFPDTTGGYAKKRKGGEPESNSHRGNIPAEEEEEGESSRKIPRVDWFQHAKKESTATATAPSAPSSASSALLQLQESSDDDDDELPDIDIEADIDA